MIASRWFSILLLAAGMLACTHHAPHGPGPLATHLFNSEATEITVGNLVQSQKLTAFVFLSDTCPCLQAHDGRLNALADTMQRQGVQFYGVASEYGTTWAQVAGMRAARRYPFDVLLDPRGALARAWNVEFAGYVVVIDAHGNIMYRGAFDSDDKKLHDDATPFLARALHQLLLGQPAVPAETAAVGCLLRQW